VEIFADHPVAFSAERSSEQRRRVSWSPGKSPV